MTSKTQLVTKRNYEIKIGSRKMSVYLMDVRGTTAEVMTPSGKKLRVEIEALQDTARKPYERPTVRDATPEEEKRFRP